MAAQRKTPDDTQATDKEGFLLRTDIWTKNVARSLAQGEVHQTLTPDHWKIIDYVRQYYLESKTVPPVRLVARSTGFSFACINELFPNGYTKGVCKIAGIPRNKVVGNSKLHNSRE
ncbi:TusE/DsrC/DsvC family sulfur relay protein [Chloroflexota bacterium]